MSPSKKLGGLTTLKNRRTSLNVNLSYISNTSSYTEEKEVEEEDESIQINSSVYNKKVDESLEKTIIIDRRKQPIVRNLSMGRSVAGEHDVSTRNIAENNMIRIKPSFVKIVRITTSTPVKNVTNQFYAKPIIEKTVDPSENSRRTSVLKDKIFSPCASVIMETSMDLTEVQGRVILNSEPLASEVLNSCPQVDRIKDSFGVIQDTEEIEESRYDIGQRMEAMIIPDSEEDSINTIRTSLNVNTSIDSRFSHMPNNSIYDPQKSRDAQFDQNFIAGNQLEEIVSHPSTQSSYGNVPTDSIIVTTAVIENLNDSNDLNIDVQEVTIRSDSTNEPHCLENTPLCERLQPDNHKSLDEKCPPNDSRSTEALKCHVTISNRENDPIEPNIPDSNLTRKPIKKKRRKLFNMQRSEMIELSPISVQIQRKKTVLKNRGNRQNKTAKKVAKKGDDPAERLTAIDTSAGEDEEIEHMPRKQKKIRKLKAKKIVIKKAVNRHLWEQLNKNSIDTGNKSCEEISSALGRTSLDDFELTKNLLRHKNRKTKPKIIIVATGLPLKEKLLIKSTVATLGSAKLDKMVTRYTTHVVGKGTRTVNLLRGIVRGCWLVGFEWISKSHESGQWVDPQKYEITGFSKAVQENRRERQLFGAAYVSELFLTCGLIHINDETFTPAPVLRDLVRIAGGRLTADPEEAKIVIGRGGFKEIWILDSIANGKIQPLNLYCKKKCLN